MRVMLVCGSLQFGGPEFWMLSLTSGFSLGVQCEVVAITSTFRAEIVERFRRNGVNIQIIDPDGCDPSETRNRLADAVLEFHPDVMVVSNIGGMFEQYGRGLGVPTVAVSHVAPGVGAEAVNTKMLGRCCDVRVGVSTVAADVFDGSSVVIPSGVDLSRLAPVHGIVGTKQRLGMTESNDYVLYVGRFSKEKNLSRIIRAIAQMQDIGMHAVFCGEGDSHSLLLAARRHGVDHAVRITSPTYNIGDLLYAACCTVVPSDSESFSMFHWESTLSDRRCLYHSKELATSIASVCEGNTGCFIPFDEERHSLKEAILANRWVPVDSKLRSIAMHNLNSQAMANRWETYLSRIISEHTVRFPKKVSASSPSYELGALVFVGECVETHTDFESLCDDGPLMMEDSTRKLRCQFIPFSTAGSLRAHAVITNSHEEAEYAHENHSIVLAIADLDERISDRHMSLIDYVVICDDSPLDQVVDRYPGKKIITAEEGKSYSSFDTLAKLVFEICCGVIN